MEHNRLSQTNASDRWLHAKPRSICYTQKTPFATSEAQGDLSSQQTPCFQNVRLNEQRPTCMSELYHNYRDMITGQTSLINAPMNFKYTHFL